MGQIAGRDGIRKRAEKLVDSWPLRNLDGQPVGRERLGNGWGHHVVDLEAF